MTHRPRVRTIIGPDGTPHLRRGVHRVYVRDLYHLSMTAPWPALLAAAGATFIAANLLFALGYTMDDGLHGARPGHLIDAFFFSMQTMTTIGSATIASNSITANLMVCLEALIGLTGFAVVTGLAFAKFSCPTVRVQFSRFAIVSDRHRIPSLMFHIANERENHLLEAQIHLVLIRSEITEEGEAIQRFHDLELVRGRNPLFALSWTAVHPIDYRTKPFVRHDRGFIVGATSGHSRVADGPRRDAPADGSRTPYICSARNSLWRPARRHPKAC